jgi:hypothetical protein
MCRSSTDRLHPQRRGSSAVGKPTRDESTSLGQVMHYAYRGYKSSLGIGAVPVLLSTLTSCHEVNLPPLGS